MDSPTRRKPTVVDLFSGCGGLSLGAQRAGFRIAVAVDNDPVLPSSYTLNFPHTRLLSADCAALSGATVRANARGTVDGVVGGPPCQSFSDIGKRDPADPRGRLVYHFFRLVVELQPTFFLMENVRGLDYSNARHVLQEALALLDDNYAVMGPRIWNAADFGAPTNRARLFVLGLRRACTDPLRIQDIDTLKQTPATVRAAIIDLEDAIPLGDSEGFDIWRIARLGRPSAYARTLRAPDGRFTSHRTTRHSSRVIARFKKVPPGSVDPVGRHPRLTWSGQCPALRAGTGADHGSHQALRPIHPERPRVITVREAARLQGFPDVHRFHSTIWHSFRMIGNSVCPIMAEKLLTAVRTKLHQRHSPRSRR